MHTRPVTHPSLQELAAFKLRQLSRDQAISIGKHLHGCAECRQTVHGTSAESLAKLLQVAPGATPPCSGTVLGGPQPAPASGTRPLPPRSGTVVGQPQPAPASGTRALPPQLANHEKFQILRQLGEGGMGTVYHAQHRIMERQVAIKVIKQSLLAEPEALARFQAEVRAAAKLQHPNIVAAYDAERAGEMHLLVMEYVEGITLTAYVQQKGHLPIELACHFVRQAALGLQNACDNGMVHRDIKPQNLMLTRKGQVKILDFGLARLSSERVEGAERNKTKLGTFLGTPEFVAPEQATDASKADIRADIYSLGCTLFFLLTGRPPFEADTVVQIVLAHLDKPAPSVQALRPDVPAALAQVVEKLLQKDPGRRFQKPAELAQALLAFCKSPAGTSEARPGKETRAGAATAVAAPVEQTGQSAVAVPVAIPVAEPVGPAATWEKLSEPAAGSRVFAARPQSTPQTRSKRKLIAWSAACAVAATLAATVIALLPGTPAKTPAARAKVSPREDEKQAVQVVTAAEPTRPNRPAEEPGDVRPPIATPAPASAPQAAPTTAADNVTPAAATAVPKPPSTPVEPPKKATREGFVPLFNGRDLEGWQPVGAAQWSVENEVLVSRGGLGYLFTAQNDYKNLHVCMEVLIGPAGNSGLALRCQNRPAVQNLLNFDHYEVDVMPRGTGNLLKTQNLQVGRLLQPVRTALPVANSWVTLEAIAEGDRFTIKVNDKLVTVYTDKSQPFTIGFLAVQHWARGGEMRYRNIEIKRLPDDPAGPEMDGDMEKGQLAVARKKHDDAMNRAKQALLTQFGKAIDNATRQNIPAEKRLKRIEQLKEEKERFQSRGLIPWSGPMRPSMVVFLTAMKAAASNLRTSYRSALDKEKNQAKARQLGLEMQDALRPSIVAQWRVNPTAVVTLFSNGTTNNPEGNTTWNYSNGWLVYTWPNRTAPGGAWIDKLQLAEDGRSYQGNNQRGAKLGGTYHVQ